jgi:hypothetical protein
MHFAIIDEVTTYFVILVKLCISLLGLRCNVPCDHQERRSRSWREVSRLHFVDVVRTIFDEPFLTDRLDPAKSFESF